jgi:hypothetical protein
MVDAVLKKFPSYDKTLCEQDINDSIRMLMGRRNWSGLVVYGILSVPAQYATGTVTVTQNSNVVTGVGTVWPFNDVVNTTLLTATIEAGIIDFQPTALTGIVPGIWVTIDGGNAGEEAVFVMSVNAAAATFQAACTKTHTSGVTITSGSMAGRQFRINSNSPFVTAVGFTSATRMLINQGWPYLSLATQSYEITMVYASLGQDVKEVLTMVNPDRQYQFIVNAAKVQLDADDPRRAISQMPYKLAFHTTDPAGAPLWEMWPRPTSVAAYPFFYIKATTPLISENDILPNGIRSDVVVKLAKAEAARWPGHKVIDGGIYYDPRLADSLVAEAERDIGYMKNEDDSTAIMQLVYQYRKWRYGGPGPDYFQNDYESNFV